jgi:hypothetical protein
MTRSRPTVDLGYPTEARGRIPSFGSIEEEAEWWDTHDSADFDEEFVRVNLTLGPDFGEGVSVRLAPGDRDELDRRAAELGVEPAELARMWVEERLHREAS